MSRIDIVSVALSAELLDTVTGAVASGEYASASEVIREALREWNLRKPLRQAEIERLRKDWQAGMESGPPRPIDFDEIKRRGRERLTRLRATGNG